MTAGARGGTMHEAAFASTHREILWLPVSCKAFFFHEKCFLFAIEFSYWGNTAFFFCVVPPIGVISATSKRSKRSRWKISTHRAHCTSSAGPSVAPSRAPQQVPNPGVINTPLSRRAPACAVPWGSLSLHELLVPKSAHPTLSIKMITVYPSSTTQEELFCRMFLFQYKVKHHLGSFVPRPWLWEKRLWKSIATGHKKKIQLLW